MKTAVTKVWTDNEAIYIETDRGDVFSEKFADYPRLATARPAQLAHFECDNIGIHWEELDEDLSYRGFMTDAKRLSAVH
jgi:hypothetical protein